MLSPSDFNNAVPQFTNGTYASNPLNPQYIAEPNSTDYNRGTEPLQTLPAQWWNWFINKFTGRFNKVNIYVKNLFNELAQLLSLVSETPSGTEGTPTVGQLKDMFETKYPDYLKTTPALSNTFVPQTTKVNGQALSGNVTITCVDCAGANGSGTAFGTAAVCGTVTGGSVTYVDYSGTNGCRLMTSNFLAYWNGAYASNGASNLRYFCGGAFGSAATCSASDFRASTWSPTCVACADKGKNGSSYSAFGSNAFNSTAFTTCTGTVTQVKVGTTAYNPTSGVISLPAYPSAPTCVACAGRISQEISGVTYRIRIDGMEGNYVEVYGECGSSNKGVIVCRAKSAETVDSVPFATCAGRVFLVANAWCACQISQGSTSIKNCCNFPILAFGYGSIASFAIYLPANGSAGIGCGISYITNTCKYGLRLY